MRRKLNTQILMITETAVLIALILTSLVSYELFKNEVFHNLKTYVEIFEQTGLEAVERYDTFKNKENNLRVTVIGKDGGVIYDSYADAGSLENHLERPEVQEALKDGSGYAVRQSTTMSMSTFYYAKLLEDGNILRVGEETTSFYRLLLGTLPILAALAVLLFFLCYLITHLVVGNFMTPIERMADSLDSEPSPDVYPELKPFLRKIRKQHEDILQSAQIRQEFTANVTHELKTPLAAISGYSELIESGIAGEQDIHHFAEEIHKSANRLLALINDIIHLSELDSTRQEIDRAQLDLYAVARDCIENLQVSAEKHQVLLQLHGESCVAELNKSMIEELFYNLCDNAINYNVPGGRVDVTVQTEEGRAVIRVKDTGIGISPEHQERIFERFYRVDKSRSKSTGGTGLGLAIVKHIVAQHQAELSMISEPGVGTEIKVVF